MKGPSTSAPRFLPRLRLVIVEILVELESARVNTHEPEYELLQLCLADMEVRPCEGAVDGGPTVPDCGGGNDHEVYMSAGAEGPPSDLGRVAGQQRIAKIFLSCLIRRKRQNREHMLVKAAD